MIFYFAHTLKLSEKELPHGSSNYLWNWDDILFSFWYFFRIIFHMSPWVDHVYLSSIQITILTTVSFTESFALTAHHNLSWCHVFLAELFSMQFSGGRPRNSTRSKMEFFIIIDSIVSTVIPFLITNFFFNEKKAINACVHYFLSNFYFFIKW